jgi:hypothetical protein
MPKHPVPQYSFRFRFLQKWLKDKNIQTALELGRDTGIDSTWFLLESGAEVWSVDIEEQDRRIFSGATESSYNLLSSLPQYHRLVADDTKPIPEVDGKMFDLILLDTSHQYEHTKYELGRYLPMARKWFLADDCDQDQVRRAVLEMRQDWQLISVENLSVWGVRIE